MLTRRQNKVVHQWQLSQTDSQKQIQWLLRSLLVIGKPGLSASGFVLPTVVMVSLVVVLLTTALLIRSFDRSKNASYVRVNQAVLNAATPALDRAKAKLDALFTDPTLPRSTPSDIDLHNAIANNLSKYTLGDEQPLKLVYDIDGGGIKPDSQAKTIEQRETLTTAWRFPVDTDNNGNYDSYTLYGIYFRSPNRDNTGQFDRARIPLEARTPPMDDSITSGCGATLGNSANLVSDSSWYKSGDKLKKSFYVYTATVPITNPKPLENYETYRGNRSFSALEFQQDRARIPLTNNAVVYEDDLEISPDSEFRLNGRIVANSNLLIGENDTDINLYQNSSKDSCYYQQEYSKIFVGGNVANGGVTWGLDRGQINVHLFQGSGEVPDLTSTINISNKSTSNLPREVGYNAQAYVQRIDALVRAQMNNPRDTDPGKIQKVVKAAEDRAALISEQNKVRREQLEIYFRDRTRRVPFSEVPYDSDFPLGIYAIASPIQGSGDTLRPPDAWMYPTNPSDTKLNLKPDQLEATEPQTQKSIESSLGDRILVGNNLPAFWFKDGAFVGAKTRQEIPDTTWKDSSEPRYRSSRVQTLPGLDVTNRDGFWETAAAKPTTTPLNNNGGLRIVTGAGVYSRVNSFLPNLPQTYDDPATTNVEKFPLVWSDTMPMTQPGDTDKGDLKMRATAVYHYAKNAYDPNNPTVYQTPIACISSYYDPSTRETAKNEEIAGGRSNNGLSYQAPTTTAANITAASPSSDGLFSSTPGANNPANSSINEAERLKYQANLKFPNGRFVNEPLRNALTKIANKENLTLKEQSAIDATICALQIADGSLNRDSSIVPNDAIKEVTFLDARQIQAIEDDNPDTEPRETFTTDGNPTVPNGDASLTGNYYTSSALSIEERQPLEIRATLLDIDKLRKTAIAGANVLPAGTQEYLLPNSGIIYASRDDALLDLSDKSLLNSNTPNIETRLLLSPVDFKLDPTRRPSGILLTEGRELWRQEAFREAEKGLILATNLPVYIKGDFNLHSGQEFANELDANWSNFYTRTAAQINSNFACRPDDLRLPNCQTGDKWRPATVLADAITLLSDNFQYGFRNEGDFDLRNNQGDRESINKRKQQGFWNNNFVTNGLSSGGLTISSVTPRDTDYSEYGANAVDSSYFNNFVTPIQRRVSFPEYVMEICRKLPMTECELGDWVVGYDDNGDGDLSDPTDKVDLKARNLPRSADADRLGAGTTAKPALVAEDRLYARRVAFSRSATNNNLERTPEINTAIPLGINDSGKVQRYPYSNPELPRQQDNALWYRTTNNTAANPESPADISYASDKPLYYLLTAPSTEQPLLVPVLQLHNTNGEPPGNPINGGVEVKSTRWMMRAAETTFNLVAAAGDTPNRVSPMVAESNGGLPNFVRFLENWADETAANISGSFIQLKRSVYATAPFTTVFSDEPGGIFDYPQAYRTANKIANGSLGDGWGNLPYYISPKRQWEFDVGLLSQSPDLFSQNFTLPALGEPSEFFREVSRDDTWIQTLLCAAVNENPTADSTYEKNAVDDEQRPNCPNSATD